MAHKRLEGWRDEMESWSGHYSLIWLVKLSYVPGWLIQIWSKGRLVPYWLAKGSHEPALVSVQIQGHYSFFFTAHTAHRQSWRQLLLLSSSLKSLFCLLLLRAILCPIFAPTPNRLRWSSLELPDRSGPYVPYGLALSLHTRPFSSTICF